MDESMTGSKRPIQSSAVSPREAEVYPLSDTRFFSLLIMFGFACFWACCITAFTSPVFAFGALVSFEHFVVRALFLLGFAAVHFCAYLGVLGRTSEKKFQAGAQVLIVVFALVFYCVSFLASFAVIEIPLIIAASVWFLFGIAGGLLMAIWGIAWTQLDAGRPDSHASALSVAGAVLLAVVLSIFMLFAPPVVALVTVAVLYLASLILQVYFLRQASVLEDIDSRASRQRLDLFSRSMLAPLFVGASFGVTLNAAFLTIEPTFVFSLALVGVTTGSVVALLALVLLKRVPRFSTFERFIFPVLGGGLLALPFTGEALRLAVIAVLIAGAICFFIVHWSVLVALSYRHHVRASFHYMQGLIAPLTGIAIGWGITGALHYGLTVPLENVVLVVSLTLAFLLVLVLSIAPYAFDKTVEAASGSVVEEEAVQDKQGSWRRRCEKVCEEYALTPREREVFLLLAKGRNTEHIAKQLFISTHTVKTHAARIYRKLSINSQQELINLVEKPFGG